MKYTIEYGFIDESEVIGTIEVIAPSKELAIHKAKLDRNNLFRVIKIYPCRKGGHNGLH